MIIFVSDAYVDRYQGGAELTTEAIISGSLFPINKMLSQDITVNFMERNKHAYWIFGNFSGVDTRCLLYAAKYLDYSVVEYDYKYCKYRSVKKHELIEGECKCVDTHAGKLTATFLAKADRLFWMSEGQKNFYENIFPFLSRNGFVLNSIFSPDTLQCISGLKTTNKNNKWIILDSPSWIKGTEDAVAYAKENNLEYELVWDLKYNSLLKKLAASKGLIFLPKAADTCPRLVIEAKLLGCEMILNEHVQHRDEEWFSDKDSILKHLTNRSDVFWQEIENVAYKNLRITPVETNTAAHFKVVVPLYNAEKWISKCVRSLQLQKNKNFKCYFVDDISTDNSVHNLKKIISDDSRFTLIQNENKRFALGNIADTLSNIECQDEDIVILLDGDDWLASTYTLDILADTYEKNSCLMTYGSYIYNPSGARGIEPSAYPEDVIKSNSYREDHWRASHLRSFKYSLWKNLNHDDLRDETGDYYKMAYDQAIMLPLLEMASDKALYVEDSLYVYNKENPISVDKIKALEQYNTAQEIRRKKKYTAI